MNKWLKRFLILVAVIGLVFLAAFAYLNHAFNQKYRGEPFDPEEVEALNAWPEKKVSLNPRNLKDFTGKSTFKNIYFDLFHDGSLYALPSIPYKADQVEDPLKMIKVTGDRIKESRLQPLEDTEVYSDFNDFVVQNYTNPNRSFNLDKNLMAYHLGKYIYGIDLNSLETKVLEEFDSDKDYTRRLAYLWYDGDFLYYILNKFDKDTESYDSGKPNLVIKDLKNNSREYVNLQSFDEEIRVEPYSDFIHYTFPSYGPYIYYTRKIEDMDQLWAYHVEEGTTEIILERPDYYYGNGTEGSSFNLDYYIEQGLYTSRYGLRVFDRANNKVLTTLVGKDRYGNISNTRLFENRYVLADRPVIQIADHDFDRNSFYLLDLKEEKTYEITLDMNPEDRIRILGIEDGILYLERMDGNGNVELKQGELSSLLK